jgi:hypothetical protein
LIPAFGADIFLQTSLIVSKFKDKFRYNIPGCGHNLLLLIKSAPHDKYNVYAESLFYVRKLCCTAAFIKCLYRLLPSDGEAADTVIIKTEPLDNLPDAAVNVLPVKRVYCFCPHGYTSHSQGHYHCRQCGESFNYVSLVNRHEKSHKELFTLAGNCQRSDTRSRPGARDQSSNAKRLSYSSDSSSADTALRGKNLLMTLHLYHVCF